MGERLKGIPEFSIDKVAAAAGSDPEMLRMENLDTDIPPPAGSGHRRGQLVAAVHRHERAQAGDHAHDRPARRAAV
jgi:hypothetical protein